MTKCDSRFLLTASEPTYRILTTGSLTAENRTIDRLGSEPLSNGTICDIFVSTSESFTTCIYMYTNQYCGFRKQVFMEVEMENELENETNGVLTIRDEDGIIMGNISCMFDEFITSK